MRALTIDRVIHGPVRTAFGGRMKYHARGGMIEVVDQITGSCQILKPDAFAQRLNDFEDFYKSCSPVGNGYEKDYRFFTRQLMEGMQACIKEAKAQGDPTDAKVRAWHERHSRCSTVSASAPGPSRTTVAASAYPELTPIAGSSLKRKSKLVVVQTR